MIPIDQITNLPELQLPGTPEKALPRPSTSHPPPLRSQYAVYPPRQVCRHWCAHGLCKWGHNCRHSHIMPMTTTGLQEVGLADWPAWFRALNSGYFAAEDQAPFLRAQRTRHVKARFVGMQVSKERIRTGGGRGPKKKTELREAEDEKKVEPGNQYVERPKQLLANGVGCKKVHANQNQIQSILLERAQMNDTRDWEDERDTTEVDGEISKQHLKMRNGEKLVDV